MHSTRIIEWSIAAFGALFVGTLALTGKSINHSAEKLQLIMFGAVLPLLVFVSARLWLWEVYRMERAAHTCAVGNERVGLDMTGMHW